MPILMMTSSAPDTAEISSLESGADNYVSESESPEVLLPRIRALLRGASAHASILNPEGAKFRSAHILAIDDSRTYLMFLCGELRDLDYGTH